ncbi:MAG: glycosyltransferase [Phycisphaerales bacterium]
MRILHISTRLILGGSQENTVLSCEGQASRGHEVHLAFGPIYGPEGSLLARVRAFGGPSLAAGVGEASEDAPPPAPGRITTHEVPHLVREVSPIADGRCFRELRALIRSLRPDVVHTHSSKAGILGRAAAWRERVPVVVHTIHGPPFHDHLPWHTNRLYIAAERYAARRCHAIIGVCDAMVRRFAAHDIGKPRQYHTVYSGMETGPFLTAAPGESREQVRDRLGLGPDDFVIGTVARLAEHKGHDDLLDALAADLKANPGWRMLWVGDGWWRERLTAKARQLGIGIRSLDDGEAARRAEPVGGNPSPLSPPLTPHAPAQLFLTGLVTPDRIPGLMRAMDVLVHPSYREGLPRTVPQALLCGVCPIAYDTDGTPEVCKEMKTGRLVRTGDRAALREAVRWAAENPLPRAALAARGREECRIRFDAERMIDELERVYAGVKRGDGPR